MGLARDKAFSFYYRANLDALEGAGVELVPFSPLEDGELPKGLDGLYLGGGFPEVFKVRLSANMSMRQSIRTALGKRPALLCGVRRHDVFIRKHRQRGDGRLSAAGLAA